VIRCYFYIPTFYRTLPPSRWVISRPTLPSPPFSIHFIYHHGALHTDTTLYEHIVRLGYAHFVLPMVFYHLPTYYSTFIPTIFIPPFCSILFDSLHSCNFILHILTIPISVTAILVDFTISRFSSPTISIHLPRCSTCRVPFSTGSTVVLNYRISFDHCLFAVVPLPMFATCTICSFYRVTILRFYLSGRSTILFVHSSLF